MVLQKGLPEQTDYTHYINAQTASKNTPNLDQQRQLKVSQNSAFSYKFFWHFQWSRQEKATHEASRNWEITGILKGSISTARSVTWGRAAVPVGGSWILFQTRYLREGRKKKKKKEIKIINQRSFSFTLGVNTLLLDAINLRDLTTGFNGKSLILCSKKQRVFPLDTMTSSIPLWSAFTSYAEPSTARFITSVQSCLQLGGQLCYILGTEFLKENEAPSFHSEIAIAALKQCRFLLTNNY